jgi:hypothetical protein
MLTDYQLNIAVEQLCRRRMQDPNEVIGEFKTHGSVARAEILTALQVQDAIAFAREQTEPRPERSSYPENSAMQGIALGSAFFR